MEYLEFVQHIRITSNPRNESFLISTPLGISLNQHRWKQTLYNSAQKEKILKILKILKLFSSSPKNFLVKLKKLKPFLRSLISF